MAAVVGVFVSLASWAFLEVIHWIQTGVFTDLPKYLGYHNGAPRGSTSSGSDGRSADRLRDRAPAGGGGHIPAEGLKVGGPVQPIDLPGVALAALASIRLGTMIGPEAPLIAIGAGLALFAISAPNRDIPDQARP